MNHKLHTLQQLVSQLQIQLLPEPAPALTPASTSPQADSSPLLALENKLANMLETQHSHFTSLHQENTQWLASFQSQTNHCCITKLDELLQGQTQTIKDSTPQVHLLQEKVNIFPDTHAASQAALKIELTKHSSTQIFATMHATMQDQLSQIT